MSIQVIQVIKVIQVIQVIEVIEVIGKFNLIKFNNLDNFFLSNE
jgi:hypothetical protein